jgi:APA family basic amino acid/polyamine antiporter
LQLEIKMAQNALKGKVGLVDVVMLGAGCALGSAIFSVLAPAAKIGGAGILITIGIAAVPMAVFGLVYAFLASVAPKTGASFEWPREFIHPFAGFMVSWLRVLGQVGQMVTLGFVLVNYVSLVLPVPARPAVLLLFSAVCVLNLLGVSTATRAQTVLMCMLIAVLTLFVVTGLPHVALSRVVPLTPHGMLPVLLAAPLLVNLFMGIESATEIGEEVKNARRNVPLGIAFALLLIAVIYFSVCFVALGLIGPVELGNATAPLVQAASRSVGALATPLIVTAAALSLLKSLNGTYLLFARCLFAMGRAGLLSARLGHVEPRHNSPRVALLAAFGCACVGLLLPNNLIFLFVASSIPLVLKYLTTCACALKVVRGRPELVAAARFRLPSTLVIALAWLGMACAVGLLGLGMADDWRAYALIGTWAALGLLYWWTAGAKQMRLHDAPGDSPFVLSADS